MHHKKLAFTRNQILQNVFSRCGDVVGDKVSGVGRVIVHLVQVSSPNPCFDEDATPGSSRVSRSAYIASRVISNSNEGSWPRHLKLVGLLSQHFLSKTIRDAKWLATESDFKRRLGDSLE